MKKLDFDYTNDSDFEEIALATEIEPAACLECIWCAVFSPLLGLGVSQSSGS